MSDKRALRARLRAARDAFARVGEVVVGNAFRHRLTTGTIVASYIPVGSEADPMPLVRAAGDAGCILALPHVVDRTAALRFLAWDADVALVAGPFGLSQPVGHASEVEPAIILTPLVGFDRRGNRIGQGAGPLRPRLCRASGRMAHRRRLERSGGRSDRARRVGRAAPRHRHRTGMDHAMTPPDAVPSWRKPAGMLLIMLLIALWCIAVVSLSGVVGRWHWLLQLAFYIGSGIAWLWLLPMRRLLLWMETGRWR